MSNRIRMLGKFALALAIGLLAAGCFAAETVLKAPSSRGGETQRVLTLQYRVARDAFAPSKFVGVVGDGITSGLTLVWALPPPKSEGEKLAQQQEKERFHQLIEMLEAQQVNGMEFECTGRLESFALHATSVPRLTEKGQRDFESAKTRK